MPARYHVYLRRQTLGTITADALAAECGISRADADRILKAKVPQAIRVEDSAEAADDTVAALRTRGFDAFHATPDELRAFSPQPVDRAERTEAGLVWRSGETRLSWAPRMIVVGKIHSEVRRTQRSGMGVGAGVAAGFALTGMPMMVRGREREVTETTRSEEAFCCLMRSRDEAGVILENGFDFRSALDRVEHVREKNFRKVVDLARGAYPDALFDDRLARYPQAVRLFAEARVESGLITHRTQTVEAGSTAARTMAAACLIFLEACGPG